MNQQDLTERLNALQNALSDIIEADPIDLDTIIKYYYLLRKFNVLEYYCKKEGYSHLGLHHIPASKVSEHNAKVAIQMGIVLKSLAKSSFGSERWTLQDTNYDQLMSPPKNCFKKEGYEVTVWFDDNRENAFPYVNWSHIYFQDEDDHWRKTEGRVDYDGMFYLDADGNKSYFILFYEDARRYSETNIWSVHYKNEHIYLPVTSSSRRPEPRTAEKSTDTSNPTRNTTQSPPHGRSSKQTAETSPGPSQRVPTLRRRRRRGEGESSGSKRQRRLSPGRSAVPSPEEVGRSHRSVRATNLSRLERLQEEARDPPIVLLRGPANKLKCWRYRWQPRFGSPKFSTVFKWVTQSNEEQDSRMLLAFTSVGERERFLETTPLPKGTSWALGSLDSL